jgi:predicted transcriptional regulator
MTIAAPDYLTGMTRAEALNYIASLPGLTKEEFYELTTLVDQRRVIKRKTLETVELRIVYVLNFIASSVNGATRNEINTALKYNGANMGYTLRAAEERGFIYIPRKIGRAAVFQITAAGRKFLSRRSDD